MSCAPDLCRRNLRTSLSINGGLLGPAI
jgi:hypothetical protein